MAGLVNRVNRVAEYQRLFQNNDGKRIMFKTKRSKLLLYPYFAVLGFGFAGSMWGMGRALFGKKTFWGEPPK